jgi:hypothetical protein
LGKLFPAAFLFFALNHLQHVKLNPMNKTQEAKRTMYMSVQQYFQTNASVVSTIPSLQTAVTAFGNLLTNLNNIRQQQETQSTGFTVQKSQLRKAMQDVALQVSSALQAYATSTFNPPLFDQARITPSGFQLMPDTEASDKARNIRDLGNTNVANLSGYGITAAVITNLTGKIDAFDAAIPSPTGAKNTVKQASIDLKNLIKSIDTFLKTNIDNIMAAYKISDPGFYNGYTNARTINDAPANSQVKSGTLAPGEIKTLPFNNVLSTHHLTLHNLGQSQTKFWKAIQPGIEPVQGGLVVEPFQTADTTVANLDGSGVFIHVKNTGPVETKFRATLHF